MSVHSLPKIGAPPAPAPLRKIALEERFGHPIVFMRNSDGRFETRKLTNTGEQALSRGKRPVLLPHKGDRG
jgi:hypothetical protein